MQDKILSVVKNEKVKVYVVWTPVLSEDTGQAAAKAVEIVSDERASHFWDGDKSLGFLLGKTVTLPRERKLAWDVYFVFDVKTKWGEGEGEGEGDAAPPPAYWMHQLADDDRRLDAGKLKDRIQESLAAQ